MSKKQKKYVLSLTHESRLMLLDYLPNLHAFQNALHYCTQSSVYLDEVVLVKENDVNNDEHGELAEALIEKYKEYINEGKTKFNVTLTHIGWDECVVAFKCNNELIGINPNKQLLVASTYEYHSRKEANKITHWIEIKPIELEAELKCR